MDKSQGRRGRDGEVEVEELGQKNKEDVSSKNTIKVGMLGKIEEKVKKERIGGGHGGARGGVAEKIPKGQELESTCRHGSKRNTARSCMRWLNRPCKVGGRKIKRGAKQHRKDIARPTSRRPYFRI